MSLKINSFLKGWQPHSKQLASEVPHAIHKLTQQLRIEKQDLDFSELSLQKLNKALRIKGRRKCLTLEIFPYLTIYIGEVIRQAVGGEWELRQKNYDDVKIWEPWVIAPNGNAIPAYSSLWEQLYEGRTCYIQSMVKVNIKRLLGDRSSQKSAGNPVDFSEHNSSSFKLTENSAMGLDIYVDSPKPEIQERLTVKEVSSEEYRQDKFTNLVTPQIHSMVKIWLLKQIPYYQTLGFFPQYSHLSKNQLAAKIETIKAEFDQHFENPKEKRELYLELSYLDDSQYSEDRVMEKVDSLLTLYLWRWDTSRTWSEWEVEETNEKNREYAKAFHRWSAISRGAFLPTEVTEFWDWETDSSPVWIKFILNGIEHIIEPEYYEQRMDLDVLKTINQLIATTGYQFELYQNEGVSENKLAIVLTTQEKQKLERQKNIRFER